MRNDIVRRSGGLSGVRLEVVMCRAAEWRQVAGDWAQLAAGSPYTTIFQTPEWVGTWIEVFSELDPQIMLVYGERHLVAGCVVIPRNEYRGPFRMRRMYLNTSGEDERDEICSEFGTLLTLGGYEQLAAECIADYARRHRTDEVVVNCWMKGTGLSALLEAFPRATIFETVHKNYYVDLAGLRSSNGTYDSALGRTTRAHVRQSLRFYEGLSDISVRCIQSSKAAQGTLEELATLHQASWQRRGKPGAFASTLFTSFHRILVDRFAALDRITFFHVTAGAQTVGIIYMFAFHGVLYFYQSGLAPAEDKHIRPGLVSHFCAIDWALKHSQFARYDFMAGDAQYKRSLSTDSGELISVRLRSPGLKMVLLREAERAQRYIRLRRERST